MIDRFFYLNKLISWKNKDVIKVVSGVRRCGKSTLFALYIDYLQKNEKDGINIISINLEDLAYEHLHKATELNNYILSQMVQEKMNYIFLDEVQNCEEFERVVDSLYIKKNTDVYITGSNAYMLSGELATLLSGRYIQINMLPFSYKEYLSAIDGERGNHSFYEYLRLGSFPYISQIKHDESMVQEYLGGIYSTILIKDIAQREGINDIPLLESIIKTLASSIGSPISANKIANTLISQGRKISVNTIEKYLKCLVESYLFYKVARYDVKGREFLRTQGKYYLVDSGLRQLLVSSLSKGFHDLGHTIENIVYLELLRRGYKVSIGKVAEKEIDFVASFGNEILYVQVSASVLDPNTLERELSPLEKVKDNYPKLLLTLDEIGSGSNYNGIKQENLVTWLLGD